MPFRRISLGVAILIGLWGCATTLPRVAMDARPAAATAKAVPTYPVPVVRLSGSPEQIGAGHGDALGETIRLLHEKYLKVFIARESDRVMARLAANAFGDLSLPEHRAEVAALARASGLDARDAMLAQCFLDLTPMTACSVVALPAGASPDGVPRMGRNLDFPSLGVADRFSTLFVVRPAGGRYGFASVGWPGMIGVLSGMNEHGLTLSNMEVTRGRRLPTGMPYTLLYRAALERCRTVGEAVSYMERTPRQTANTLMLMDAAGDRAVVELTPEAVVVRRAPDAEPLVSTNHHRGPDGQTPGLCPRYDYLRTQSTRDFGGIRGPAVEAMLRRVGGAMTLQSMVFEPQSRTLHLAVGTNAADRTFTRVELAPLFE